MKSIARICVCIGSSVRFFFLLFFTFCIRAECYLQRCTTETKPNNNNGNRQKRYQYTASFFSSSTNLFCFVRLDVKGFWAKPVSQKRLLLETKEMEILKKERKKLTRAPAAVAASSAPPMLPMLPISTEFKLGPRGHDELINSGRIGGSVKATEMLQKFVVITRWWN